MFSFVSMKKGLVAVAEVPSSQSQLMGKFGVETVPAVVVLPSGNVSLPFDLESFEPEQAIKYDGDIKSMEELSSFLEQHSPPKKPSKKPNLEHVDKHKKGKRDGSENM